MTQPIQTPAGTTELSSPRAARLLDEHAHLDRLFEDLLNRAESGEWSLCDAVWDDLSRKLEAHMRFEETQLLPGFDASSAASGCVTELLAEHAQIRASLAQLGVAVQVHALREENVRALVQLLRDHARRENLTLYPWAAEQPRRAEDDTWLW